MNEIILVKDMRSPLAKARDKFMNSEKAARLFDTASLGIHNSQKQYLRNRIEAAFLAGANLKKWRPSPTAKGGGQRE